MEITLEKIELVKDRTGVSYKEAKEALEAADGSVVDAIINIEESINSAGRSKMGEQGAAMLDRVKELVRKGNISKIIVKKNHDVILNLPVNIGIIGTVLAPYAALAGVIAAFGTKCVIELVKDDGEIIEISEMASDTFDEVMERGADFVDDVREKGADVIDSVKSRTHEAINRSKREGTKEEPCASGSEYECAEDCTCGGDADREFQPSTAADAAGDAAEGVRED